VLAGGFATSVILFVLMLFLPRAQEKTMSQQMEMVYTICALLGGTLLVCQFVLSLLSGEHHHDVAHDVHDFGGHDHIGGDHDAAHDTSHDAAHEAQSSWFTGLLTFRTVVAALTFFGLAGRAAGAMDMHVAESFAVAVAAGAGALFLVGWLMRSLYRLKAEGTARIERAIGQCGTVYLPVPGNRTGVGKIHLNLQNRTMEYQAVTSGEPLSSGTRVTVVAVIGSDTVEVLPAPASERITHV
jgi:hypothetical protein